MPSAMPWTSRQTARTTKATSSRTTNRRTMSPSRAAAGAEVLVRGAHAVERLLCGARLLGVGRDPENLLPGRRRAVQVLLAERAHDALVEERLGVARVDGQ